MSKDNFPENEYRLESSYDYGTRNPLEAKLISVAEQVVGELFARFPEREEEIISLIDSDAFRNLPPMMSKFVALDLLMDDSREIGVFTQMESEELSNEIRFLANESSTRVEFKNLGSHLNGRREYDTVELNKLWSKGFDIHHKEIYWLVFGVFQPDMAETGIYAQNTDHDALGEWVRAAIEEGTFGEIVKKSFESRMKTRALLQRELDAKYKQQLDDSGETPRIVNYYSATEMNRAIGIRFNGKDYIDAAKRAGVWKDEWRKEETELRQLMTSKFFYHEDYLQFITQYRAAIQTGEGLAEGQAYAMKYYDRLRESGAPDKLVTRVSMLAARNYMIDKKAPFGRTEKLVVVDDGVFLEVVEKELEEYQRYQREMKKVVEEGYVRWTELGDEESQYNLGFQTRAYTLDYDRDALIAAGVSIDLTGYGSAGGYFIQPNKYKEYMEKQGYEVNFLTEGQDVLTSEYIAKKLKVAGLEGKFDASKVVKSLGSVFLSSEEEIGKRAATITASFVARNKFDNFSRYIVTWDGIKEWWDCNILRKSGVEMYLSMVRKFIIEDLAYEYADLTELLEHDDIKTTIEDFVREGIRSGNIAGRQADPNRKGSKPPMIISDYPQAKRYIAQNIFGIES